MSCVVIKPDFAYAKTKAQISLAVTAKLILSFVFATQIVLFLIYVKPYFQASSLLPCLYRPVCVLPCRNPRRPAFSRRGSIIFDTNHRKITNAKGCGSICWDSTNVNGLE